MKQVHRQEAMDPEASCFILEDGAVNSTYRVGLLGLEHLESEPSVQVIFVTSFGGKTLVALPAAAWHQRTAKRILPAGCFSKATAIEVLAVDPLDMLTPLEGQNLRLWVGFLAADYANVVDFSQTEFEADYCFEGVDEVYVLPYADSLVEIANEHFAFFSAAEETEEREVVKDADGAGGDAGVQGLGERLQQLEETVFKMSKAVDLLVNPPRASERPTTPRVSFASPPSTSLPRTTRSSTTSPASRPGALRKRPQEKVNLDPAVIEAATQAGLGPEVIEEVKRLMGRNVKAQRVRDVSMALVPDPLSEAEDDEEAEVEGGEHGSRSASGDPMHTAVTQLAEIMKMLTDERKKKSSSQLESALDFSTGSSTDVASIGTGKRSAAARRALRAMLVEHPQEIYAMVERLMQEDLSSQSLPPGMQSVPVTARAWVEHRSKIGAYKTLAHSAWGVAGALDALCRGQTDAARARLAVLLLQLGQSAVDRGSWYLASELSLEYPPPFGNLAQHSPPAEGEAPYSRLLDPRWGELALAHLKEQDDFQTRRRNLGKSTKKEETEAESESSKRRPKAKPKPKAAPEGGV